jgi:hypothetical protein
VPARRPSRREGAVGDHPQDFTSPDWPVTHQPRVG